MFEASVKINALHAKFGDWDFFIAEMGGKASNPLHEYTSRPDGMRPNEQRKIDCGKVHFEKALGVSYRVVKSAAELP